MKLPAKLIIATRTLKTLIQLVVRKRLGSATKPARLIWRKSRTSRPLPRASMPSARAQNSGHHIHLDRRVFNSPRSILGAGANHYLTIHNVQMTSARSFQIEPRLFTLAMHGFYEILPDRAATQSSDRPEMRRASSTNQSAHLKQDHARRFRAVLTARQTIKAGTDTGQIGLHMSASQRKTTELLTARRQRLERSAFVPNTSKTRRNGGMLVTPVSSRPAMATNGLPGPKSLKCTKPMSSVELILRTFGGAKRSDLSNSANAPGFEIQGSLGFGQTSQPSQPSQPSVKQNSQGVNGSDPRVTSRSETLVVHEQVIRSALAAKSVTDQLADQVMQRIEHKLKVERQRRGL